jgi:hypothetical protein
MQEALFARSFARAKAGNNIAARIAMMAITTNNSIKVNARLRDRFFLRRVTPSRFLTVEDEVKFFTKGKNQVVWQMADLFLFAVDE